MKESERGLMDRLLDFLKKLDEGRISWRLSRPREEAIMVEVAVPGERWEIEFVADGSVEVEVFRSSGEIEGADAIDRLMRMFGEHRGGPPAGA